MKTKIIVGFPCIGKTSLYQENKDKYMDLEFRETASTKGMDEQSKLRVFSNYLNIVKEIVNTEYYDYLFVTDNILMIKNLIECELEFTFVGPNPNDVEFINTHYKRVLNRNNQLWYKNIIIPRLNELKRTLELLRLNNINIVFLNNEAPFLKDVIKNC